MYFKNIWNSFVVFQTFILYQNIIFFKYLLNTSYSEHCILVNIQIFISITFKKSGEEQQRYLSPNDCSIYYYDNLKFTRVLLMLLKVQPPTPSP